MSNPDRTSTPLNRRQFLGDSARNAATAAAVIFLKQIRFALELSDYEIRDWSWLEFFSIRVDVKFQPSAMSIQRFVHGQVGN